MKTKEVIGNKTEGSLLLLSEIFGADYQKMRDMLTVGEDADAGIYHKLDFSSERKRMSMVIDMEKFQDKSFKCSTKYLSLCKGASEIMLDRCSKYIDEDNQIKSITSEDREFFESKIHEFARQSLRTLILGYKEIPGETDDHDYMESDLVMVCLVGIQDPLRPGVEKAIDSCFNAGITVRMVTGDNKETAIAISKDAHIIPRDASEEDLKKMVITGPEFAKLSNEEIDALLPTLRCMARSSPKDKYKLVCRLKAQNYVVAATGDGSNDAPQLKVANVGLSMGIAGTEVAKEASDIVIMNDNFCTIVRAVEWGRTITANIRKFIQFQLSVSFAAVVIAFVGAVALDESPLTSIQLLYVNLIMDSMGALALATEEPSKHILQEQPVHRSASMITPCMLRNIIVVGAYQVIISLCMIFEKTGDKFTLVPDSLMADGYDELRIKYRYTCIYNFFLYVQIFNMINSRRIGNELYIFDGLLKNGTFWTVFLIAGGF